MRFDLSWRDVFRPIFGLITAQPALALFFFVVSDDWWNDYVSVGWPLNIVVTIWLIPCYAVYERLWNRKEQSSYSQSVA